MWPSLRTFSTGTHVPRLGTNAARRAASAGVEWIRTDETMRKARTMTAVPADTTTVTPTEETAQQTPVPGEVAWAGFRGGLWRDAIAVRDFVQSNYTPYEGDASFLTGPTERTTKVWDKLLTMFPDEIARGIHDVDVSTPSRIDAFAPGYIDPDLDLIVGLQTDAPSSAPSCPTAAGAWSRAP